MGIETLAIASLAGSVGSAGLGFFGAQQEGAAAAGSARYTAQVARNNATIAAQNAQYATESGAVRAQTQDFKNRATQGQIKAQQGASGIDLESPSSAAVRDSAHDVGRLDTETLYNNALISANNALTQSTNFQAEAGLSELKGQNAQSAAGIKGFGSLLGGVSSFSDKWLRYQNVGVSGFGSAL